MFQVLKEEKYRRWIIGIGLNTLYVHESTPYEVESELRARGVNVIRVPVLRAYDSGQVADL